MKPVRYLLGFALLLFVACLPRPVPVTRVTMDPLVLTVRR